MVCAVCVVDGERGVCCVWTMVSVVCAVCVVDGERGV